MNEKSISNFLNEENKNYALYVLKRRAIPSVIDGLKTTQRKVLEALRKLYNTNNQNKKVYQIAGIVADQMAYHHSNQALEETIIVMGQDFKNNIPLLKREGQWGDLRVPQGGASRYIGGSLDKIFFDIFKDFDLTIKQYEDKTEIEPKYYYPIIPMILINGGIGIAVGFSSKILNRDPKRIIDACLKYLKGEKFNNSFKPSIKEFSGKIEQDKNNKLKWLFYGDYEKINSTNILIKEYHPFITYEKIEENLQFLEEKKIITSYINESSDKINITVKFKKEILSSFTDDELRKLLKLDSSFTENLTLIDENEKIIIFKDIKELIMYFVDFRLKIYQQRKEKAISIIENEINILKNKINFLNDVIKKKITLNNTPKDKIIKQLEKLNYLKVNNNYNYLLNLSFLSLTKEKLIEYKNLLKDKKEEIKKIKSKSAKQSYIDELTYLKSIL